MKTTTTEIKWTATPEESSLILACVKRMQTRFVVDTLTASMDLEAVHSNGTPLDFARLLAFSDFDFFHDVCGINNRIDRETGKLTHCFLPRCAR